MYQPTATRSRRSFPELSRTNISPDLGDLIDYINKKDGVIVEKSTLTPSSLRSLSKSYRSIGYSVLGQTYATSKVALRALNKVKGSRFLAFLDYRGCLNLSTTSRVSTIDNVNH